MNFQSVCMLLLCVGGVVHAQSDICCVPDQWEGIEKSLVGTVRGGRAELSSVNIKIYYDFTNTRLAAFSNVSTEFGNFETLVLQIYTNPTSGTEYVYNLDTKRCTKTPLAAPIKRGCIPGDAKKVRDLVFGLGDQTIAATEYEMKVQNLDATVTMTSSCVPITEAIGGTVVTPTGEESLVEAVEFSDIKLGISRTDVFNVPSECQQAPITARSEKSLFIRRSILFT